MDSNDLFLALGDIAQGLRSIARAIRNEREKDLRAPLSRADEKKLRAFDYGLGSDPQDEPR